MVERIKTAALVAVSTGAGLLVAGAMTAGAIAVRLVAWHGRRQRKKSIRT